MIDDRQIENAHHVDPEFVSRLEERLRTEMRRHDHTPGRGWKPIVLRTALPVLIALTVGFASATAAQQISARAEARYLRVEAEGAVRLAELRVELLEDMLTEARTRDDMMDAETQRQVEWEAHRARLDLSRAQLDLAEVRAAHERARNDLGAPLVDGTDYVAERLALEKGQLEGDVARIRAASASAVDPETRSQMEHEAQRIEQQLDGVLSEIALRRDFLKGTISAEEIERRQAVENARAAVEITQSRVEHIEATLGRIRDLRANGEIESYAVRQAEFELASARIDARLARARLELEESGRR